MAVSTLDQLRADAATCTDCDLYRDATQTVFGEGPATADAVLVGEQPGDQEDRTGAPFVGPAGRVLDDALRAAGVDRTKVYVTNAVKHFKFEQRGKRRIHQRPNRTEQVACHRWIESELASIRPRLVVCLGAVAATSLLGPKATVARLRGRPVESDLAELVAVTVHPSSILRAPDDEARRLAYDGLRNDLAAAFSWL
ncbi:MAG TPA: UdgX family uracil-DNA binding protein [Acidimicrobiales bacterium]|nr:UdgX family uracil-DNA binding protein [Acidimicrobiales bacterium]